MYYTGDKDHNYCKVVLSSPKLVPTLRGLVQKGIHIYCSGESVPLPKDVFEANIPFELRFMVDTSMTGSCWIEGKNTLYNYDLYMMVFFNAFII